MTNEYISLDELAKKCGTDKSSEHHNYARLYEKYLTRGSKVNLLELGWGGFDDPYEGGQSGQMWKEYFHPESIISLIDNHQKVNNREGINLYIGSQSDGLFLRNIHNEHGDFDIIIDDASHISSLTIKSFQILFPLLKSGGLYIVEDLHSSYHQYFYGYSEADTNPETNVKTAMMFFKRLTDEVNKGNIEDQYHLGYDIEFIHFYFDIVFIKKA